MELTINYVAGTVTESGKTYDIKSLGINPQTNSKSEVEQFLNEVDFSKFKEKSEGVDTFTSTATSSNVINSKSSTEIQAEIDKLEGQKTKNKNEINKIEQKIQELIEQATNKISEAAQIQKNESNAYQKAVEQAVQEELSNYADANKNGKGMTKNELSQNLQSAIPNVPGLSNAIASLSSAKGLISQIDSNITKMQSLINKNKSIEAQIDIKQSEYENAVKVEQNSEQAAIEAAVNNSSQTNETENANKVQNKNSKKKSFVGKFFNNLFSKNTGLSLSSSLDANNRQTSLFDNKSNSNSEDEKTSLFSSSSLSLKTNASVESSNISQVKIDMRSFAQSEKSNAVINAEDYSNKEETQDEKEEALA